MFFYINIKIFNYELCNVSFKCLYQVRVITVFTVFRLLTDFVCLYTYVFWLSLCKIIRSSVILLLPLFTMFTLEYSTISTDINRQKHFTCGEYVNIKTFFY
jgi:hypothetical protein